VGLDPRHEYPGMGLHTMRERVEQMRGVLHIESAPGQGVQVRVRLPLPGDRRQPAD
jgi:signal transduction histidine kinase